MMAGAFTTLRMGTVVKREQLHFLSALPRFNVQVRYRSGLSLVNIALGVRPQLM